MLLHGLDGSSIVVMDTTGGTKNSSIGERQSDPWYITLCAADAAFDILIQAHYFLFGDVGGVS